jgi:hypothetical protein
MALRNQSGIVSYEQFHDAYEAGTPQGDGRDVPYENPLVAQISTITITGTAAQLVEDQVFSTTVTDPNGVAYAALYTVDAADAAIAVDADAVERAGLRVAQSLNALADLANILTATSGTVAGGDEGLVTLTFLHPPNPETPLGEIVWTAATVIAPAVAEPTMAAASATPQNAGGVLLPMARWAAYGTPVGEGQRRAIRPSAGDRLAGIILRDISVRRGFSTLDAAANEHRPGDMVTVREEGDVAMFNRDPAAVSAGDPVFVIVDPLGGGAVGEARASAAGIAQITTATPTVANDTTYSLLVDIPAAQGLPALQRTFTILSDGTATDQEICDAFRAAMAADAAFTARIVASGTTTLVLTGQTPGAAFVVADVQEGAGDWTSITLTQAAVAYTEPAAESWWNGTINPGGVGLLHVNR